MSAKLTNFSNSRHLRLGVNIDHVATIRNARGGSHPDPVAAAILAQEAGADGITVHLRQDRRHIRDEDLLRLAQEITLPINLEMAATDEMLKIALKTKPNAVCIVPEKRQELTTEGGLNVVLEQEKLAKIIAKINAADLVFKSRHRILISLFVDPNFEQIECAKKIGADIVELHTGEFCNKSGKERQSEFLKLKKCAEYAASLGLECHAGHGLNYETARKIAEIEQIVELNIGHFIIGEAIFEGLANVIIKMKTAIRRLS